MLVYHRAYWQRQLCVLRDVFKRCSALLGARELERLLVAYIERAPSDEPCIERTARGFVEFLSTAAPVSPRTVDVARLEWATLEALLAPDAPRVVETPAHAGRAFAASRLSFVPSLRLDRVARAAWEFYRQGGESVVAEHADTVHVATWRQSCAVRQLLIREDEAQAFGLARSGATLAEICTAFVQLPPTEAIERAHGVLGAWFTREWISAFEVAKA